MTFMGTTRLLLFRMGMEGQLEDPEDILYLTGDDVDSGASGLRGLAANGRSRHEQFRKVQPPTEIGVPRSPDSPASLAETELHGLPASRGVVTARARVLASAGRGRPRRRNTRSTVTHAEAGSTSPLARDQRFTRCTPTFYRTAVARQAETRYEEIEPTALARGYVRRVRTVR
jgi:hypothetical protein